MNLVCAAIVVINMTSGWTPFDQKTLEGAKVRCKQLYGTGGECVRKFTKVKDDQYRVICGEKVQKDSKDEK